MSYFQSWAEWPAGLVHNISGEGENMTVDKHATRAQAEAVCDMLRRDGLGGDRIHFPLRTWTKEVE